MRETPQKVTVDKSIVDRVLGAFLIGFSDEIQAFLSRPIPNIRPEASDIESAFRENLRSALVVATLPFQMAVATVGTAWTTRIHAAARIRAAIAESNEDEIERLARIRVKAQITEEGIPGSTADQIVLELNARLADPEFAATARELLLQTHTAVWASFEVLVSDLLRLHLNKDPALAVSLMADASARRHLPSRPLAIESLAAFGYDVSEAMGTLLLGDRNVDSLPVMRDLIEGVFNLDQPLRERLHSEEIWKAWQRRHVIVHRRGKVDDDYISKTGDKIRSGDRLTLTARDVESVTVQIQKLGTGLLLAVPIRPS